VPDDFHRWVKQGVYPFPWAHCNGRGNVAGISLAGDIAFFTGFAAAARGVQGTGGAHTLLKASMGIDGSVALFRGVQGGIEIANGDNREAAAHIGEATLLLGIGVSKYLDVPTVHGVEFVGPKGIPSQLNVSGKQFGQKMALRARELGLDPSSSKVRHQFRSRIERIFKNADEVRSGPFRGQGPNGTIGGDNRFFRRGNDVVVTDANGNFITLLTDGVNNGFFKGGVPLR